MKNIRGAPPIVSARKIILFSSLIWGELLLSFSAYADWPILQTEDTKTVLDLTTQSNGIDLLECGMWVEQVGKHFYLRNNSGKEIPIPTLAIKAIQDKVVVDVALNAKLFGLSTHMMSIVLKKHGDMKRWDMGTWSPEKQKEKRSSYHYSQHTSFLIDGNRQQLLEAINAAMVENKNLSGFTLQIYPPEKGYEHLVMELVASEELSEGVGAPLLHWALLSRGISKHVTRPFFEVISNEASELTSKSNSHQPSLNVLQKISSTEPIRTQLTYTCLIDENVTH